MEDKTCQECRKTQPITSFSPKQATCKSCRATRRRLRYALRNASRPDTCENPRCDLPPTDLDHNHWTGEWRGWLCHTCNVALGYMEDDPEAILGLSEYIRERRGKRLTKIHEKIRKSEQHRQDLKKIDIGHKLCPSCKRRLMLDSWRSCFECWRKEHES